jgi:hypothetical protein
VATEYKSIVGNLQYLMHTQLNPTFAVRFVSHFMEVPIEEHLAAMKHILYYIVGSV